MRVFLYILLFFPLGALAQVDTTVMPEEKKAAYKKIESYRQRVLKGESMATLATLYSEDPGTRYSAGKYENISRGSFVPEFEKAAFDLEPGGISEVFETTYGFHFIQLIAKHDDQVDLRHILIKTNK